MSDFVPVSSKTFAQLLTAVVLAGVVLAAPILVGGASAAEPGDAAFDRPGWYGGIGFFAALSDYDITTDDLDVVPPQPADTDPDFGHSGGIDARVGYRLNSRVALELDYQWQSGFDSREPSIDPPLEIDTHLVSFNAKLFALTDRWQPYGLIGASLLVFNSEIVDEAYRKPWEVEVGFAPRFAGGIDCYLTPSWLLSVEASYIVPVGTVSGANMASVGAGFQYRW